MASGRIKGITIEIEGKTDKLNNALKGIDGQLNKTQKSLKDVDKLLKLNPGNTELLKQKQKQLADSIKQTKTRLDQLKEAQSHVDEGSAEWDALQREIIDTENKLKSLEKEYEKFGSVGAQQVAAVGEKMKTVGSKMSDIGQDLTTKVTLPLAAAGAVGAKKFAEVDKVMQLTNKTMGNTEAQAQLLDAAMKSAAANSTYGMNDAATATLNFARAGLNAEEAASALAPAMNLAAGEGGNLDTVSAGLVATINGFGGSFDDAAKYADVFANACNNSALDVDSLAESMSIAAPIFKAAGYGVNDAALYMGIMANKGIDANVAANSLKTGLARLVEPSKQGAEWLEKLGVEITNADGSMKDSVTIQKDLHKAFSGLSESEQIAAASAIFGKNQMSNWLALINTAPDEVDNLSAALGEEGTTAEMAEAMMSGFGGSIEKLKSSIDVAATSLGQALAPTILKVAEGIQKAVDWFNSLNESQQQLIAKIGLIAAALGPVLLIGGKLLIGIGQLMTFAPKIVAFGGAIAKGFGVVKAAIAGLTFNPIVLGIAAAVAAGIWLYKNWDTVKAKAAELKENITQRWEELKANTVAGWTNLKTTISNAASQAKANVVQRWNELKTNTAAGWESMRLSVTSRVSSMVTTASARITALRTSAATAWSGMLANASATFESIRSAITSKLESAKSKVTSIISSIKSKFPFNIGKIINFKTPHISLNTGSKTVLGKTITYPTGFSVSWYRRAYDTPIEFTRRMIIPTMGGFKGFGDGPGSEIVYGKRKLLRDVAWVARELGYRQTVINVYARDGQSAREIAMQVRNILVTDEQNHRMAWA